MAPVVLAAESSDLSAGAVAAIVLGTLLVVAILTVPYVVGLWKVLQKTGRPGWGAVVPIYNNWLVIEVVGRPAWWLAMLFIPYASIVFAVILMLDLAKSFGKSSGFGIGLAFLPFVFMPMLGFGDAAYLGPSVMPPTSALPPSGLPPAGWYPDPWQQAAQRWWDGTTWTSHTA